MYIMYTKELKLKQPFAICHVKEEFHRNIHFVQTLRTSQLKCLSPYFSLRLKENVIGCKT